MQTVTEPEKITLYYRQGSSDKIYQASIEPCGAGFAVNFAFGRRGATLQTGTKTSSPVNYSEAKKIFDKIIREKTAKGYTPGEDGTPYQQTDKAQRSTGILPQLLNPIDESEVAQLIEDDAWWAQEKFDGKRVLILKEGGRITGINRKGLTIDLPVPIVQAMQILDARRCLLDGEAVGDVLIAFDLLQEATIDLASRPYHDRYSHLVDLVDSIPSDSIRYAQTATTKSQKLAMLNLLRKEHKEGIVFKRHSALYVPGRPANGGDQLKLKFAATASCGRQRQPPKREAGTSRRSQADRCWQRHHPSQSIDPGRKSDCRGAISLCLSRRKPLSAVLSGQTGRCWRSRLHHRAIEIQIP
jgi:bifunctional non-homologous end joining protein LigD